MRVVMISGFPKSGRSGLFARIVSPGMGAMANSEETRRSLPSDVKSDFFPTRSPCARPRQFSHWMSKILGDWGVDVLVSEPPGMCTETVSPILVPIMVSGGPFEIGPLITVVDGARAAGGLSADTADDHKTRMQIGEADIVAIHSDGCYDTERARRTVESLNRDAEIVLFSLKDGCGIDLLRDAVVSERLCERVLKSSLI